MVPRATLRHGPRRDRTGRAAARPAAPPGRPAPHNWRVESLEPRTLLAVAPAGPEFRVNTTTLHEQERPSVAMDAQGEFVVAWQSMQQDGSGSGVYARRYGAAGEALGGEFRVNATTANDQAYPAVAADAEGDFVVVWQDNHDGDSDSDIHARRYDSAGQPLGGEFLVNTAATQWARPVIAMNADGAFVVAWSSRAWDDSGSGVFARRFDADGRPLGDEFRVNVTTRYGYQPSVALNADGDFMIAWWGRGGHGEPHGAYARRYTAAGQPVGGEFTVSAATEYNQPVPAVAAGTNGLFVIAWAGSGVGYRPGVFARRYDAAGLPLGDEVRVNVTTVGTQAAVAAAPDGGFVVAWHDRGLWARRLDAAGRPLGGEFRVDPVAHYGSAVSVAADADGDLVLAWQNHSDGSGLGVYARRYERLSNPATAGGRVWNDLDGDAVRGPAEPGVDGVTVRLVSAERSTPEIVVTSGGGLYHFDSLRPGDSYYLEFVLPSGFIFAEADQGRDDSLDSDVDPETGRTPAFALEPGQVDLTRDAGLVALASVAGVKFNDRDRDGTRDPGEEGLAGWVVYLDADADGRLDPDERSTATGSNGAYRIMGVRPGAYRVTEAPQDLWEQTAPAGGFHEVELAPGANATGIDFGNHTAVPESFAGPVGPDVLIHPDWPIRPAANPRIAAAADGAFVVAWSSFSQDGFGRGVYARRYDAAGRPAGAEFLVGPTIGYDDLPAVAMDADGDFVVAWRKGMYGGIFARRYDRTGRPLGSEFRVSADTRDWRGGDVRRRGRRRGLRRRLARRPGAGLGLGRLRPALRPGGQRARGRVPRQRHHRRQPGQPLGRNGRRRGFRRRVDQQP